MHNARVLWHNEYAITIICLLVLLFIQRHKNVKVLNMKKSLLSVALLSLMLAACGDNQPAANQAASAVQEAASAVAAEGASAASAAQGAAVEAASNAQAAVDSAASEAKGAASDAMSAGASMVEAAASAAKSK